MLGHKTAGSVGRGTLARWIAWIGAAAALSWVPSAFARAPGAFARAPGSSREEPESFRITGVTVVDVEAGRLIPGRTVLVRGGRIESIVPSENEAGERENSSPGDARVVRGSGLYLIPGLFDAHVHLSASTNTFPKLLLAHGVTAVRDTGATTDAILSLREGARGDALLPRIVCTGAILDGDPAFWPFSKPCDEPDEARAAVQDLARAGVDQIKVYSFLEKDVYEAAVAEAHRIGLKVTGHVPAAVTLREALAAGQDCVEHLTGFDRALARILGREPPAHLDPLRGEFDAWFDFESAGREPVQALLADIAEAGMVQCPTLVVMAGIGRASDPAEAEKDPRMAYVPAYLRAFWSRGYEDFGKAAKRALPHMQAMVGQMFHAGVPLLVGTDLANPYVFAGSAVHDEMRLFQDAGIPPADVLRAATIAPARFCGIDGEIGTVSPGKEASLVLLRKNPLEDIANVDSIEAVFLRGRYLDREQLDALLGEVAGFVAASMPAGEVRTAESAAGGSQAPGGAAEASGGAAETAGGVAQSPQDWLEKDLEGEVAGKGRYAMKFGQFDAGVEDFVITIRDQGYTVRAYNQPKGGPQMPFLLEVRVAQDHTFVSAHWRQLTENPLVADYTREGNTIHVTARQGEETVEQVLELPEDALLTPPANATEFAVLASTGLQPGESHTFQAVGFGFAPPPWQLAVTADTITRLEDTTLMVAGRGEVAARHYKAKMALPFGDFDREAWTDEHGVLLRSVLVMPFGTVTAELVAPESSAAPR